MNKVDNTPTSRSTTRRKFLGGAAVAGVATIAMPQVSRAQTVTLKMQSGFGATDILSDYGRDYVAKVNELGGGRLKIDFLNSGAVVKPFSVMDATSTGVLDGNYSVPAYWYGKHRAASLFGTGPVYGTNADQYMGWFYYGGGDALYRELTQDVLKLNVVGFFAFAMPTQPLGWFKTEVTGPESFKGLKYRTVGLASNVMQAMGASVAQLPGPEILPAMEKGVIDAFEFNNPTSDSRFGAQDVAKFYYLGSYHQASEAIEVVFNKSKFDGLAKEQQQILQGRRDGILRRQRLEGLGHLLEGSRYPARPSTACRSSARRSRSSRRNSPRGTRSLPRSAPTRRKAR